MEELAGLYLGSLGMDGDVYLQCIHSAFIGLCDVVRLPTVKISTTLHESQLVKLENAGVTK